MATTSVHSRPLSSPPPPSPPRKRLSKVFSGGSRRSSDVQSDSGTLVKRGSADSTSLTKSLNVSTQRSSSNDGSTKSGGSSGMKKLIPGHAKRERRKLREDELGKITQEEAGRGRQPAPGAAPGAPAELDNPKSDAVDNRSRSSLVTVESDVEAPPPLTSRDSHAGYLTMTSPLIKTTTVGGSEDTIEESAPISSHNPFTEQLSPKLQPSTTSSRAQSPKSGALGNVPTLPQLPGLIDKADTLRPDNDARARGKSPSKRFKEVFARTSKSPKVSPERTSTEPPAKASPDVPKPSTGFRGRRLSNNPEARGPSPLSAQTLPNLPPAQKSAMPALQTNAEPPKTPPRSLFANPTTTVTPPTPTDRERPSDFPGSTTMDSDGRSPAGQGTNTPQNGTSPLSHRRVRSASGTLGHQKSKLSTSMAPPLTPMIEETGTPPPLGGPPGSRNGSGGGFFSSWVSAAQNAATSITNLTNQNRSRTGTNSSDTARPKALEEQVKDPTNEQVEQESEEPKKELAVNTLGAGELNLSHLGIDAGEDRAISLPQTERGGGLKLDIATAKIEDLLAKRAVSQAYEKPGKSGEATPIAEISDPVMSARPASTFDTLPGRVTPPNGSIFDGDGSTVRRTNSVRSKLHNRRSRNSSITTAQSTLGTMVGPSTTTLTNSATGPKLSGFAIAPKSRNRAFHQLFRSVPDDDCLIEDYSCALQKEILLAGRIYISEGHICFSSNILGWVTTLIISFEEVVSIEKENTAIVIPNAIAVQTLHARHTFRSLLSREATYDLMIGIWRVSHPDSFQKSMNGQQLAAGITSAENVAGTIEGGDAAASEDDSDEESGSDDDDSPSSVGSGGSIGGTEVIEAKSLSRRPSGGHAGGPGPTVAASAAAPAGDATAAVTPIVGNVDGAQDFPGPAIHAPTEYSDGAASYDKLIKDEIIQAPIGKLYTLLYGPQSGAFIKRFLVEGVSKVQDLQLEDDKKGLDADAKTRKYQYVKPLGGSIGPKQTTCITTETLEFFDLDRAVCVTCATLTPDVPSGSAFSTKTRYCLTWAPGNVTRFQMNMTIEWTAKSWLKGPIEKGALDGQMQYGEDLVKTLRSALGRARAATTSSKVQKGGKKKRRGLKKEKSESSQPEPKKAENWGPLELFRPILGPVVSPVKSFVSMNLLIGVLTFMVVWMWFRGSSSSTALTLGGRGSHVMYYDDIWRQEESDLWDWLQDRAGVDGSVLRDHARDSASKDKDNKAKLKQRQKLLKSKDVQSRLREEKKSMKEMEEAVRVTQERLDSLQRTLERQRSGQS